MGQQAFPGNSRPKITNSNSLPPLTIYTNCQEFSKQEEVNKYIQDQLVYQCNKD